MIDSYIVLVTNVYNQQKTLHSSYTSFYSHVSLSGRGGGSFEIANNFIMDKE